MTSKQFLKFNRIAGLLWSEDSEVAKLAIVLHGLIDVMYKPYC